MKKKIHLRQICKIVLLSGFTGSLRATGSLLQVAYTLNVCNIIYSTKHRDPHKLARKFTLKFISLHMGVISPRIQHIYSPCDGSKTHSKVIGSSRWDEGEGEDGSRASHNLGAPQ